MPTVRDFAEEMILLFEGFGTDNKIAEMVSAQTFYFFKEFLNTAFLMRKNQRDYFKHRDQQFLVRSKEYEAKFDAMLVALIEEKNQSKLPLG